MEKSQKSTYCKVPSENKALKSFSAGLVREAVHRNWDDGDVGKLLHLILSYLKLTNENCRKFLINCRVDSPEILSQLVDDGFQLKGADIVYLLRNNCASNEIFVTKINTAIESGLISLRDVETMRLVRKKWKIIAYCCLSIPTA